ncbi:hypothetical protein EK21DRAFT_106038 [Setomelanomma holmii]|uniref:Uncharacterized protein n=1 Tax=Setomelanomma holmii TaxID=210430 RepID=A0A9P4LUE6_9PLEO|nr:hypothetical protein EK21DRAFT_106038 [Setomelanomma holmii]
MPTSTLVSNIHHQHRALGRAFADLHTRILWLLKVIKHEQDNSAKLSSQMQWFQEQNKRLHDEHERLKDDNKRQEAAHSNLEMKNVGLEGMISELVEEKQRQHVKICKKEQKNDTLIEDGSKLLELVDGHGASGGA